MPLTPSLPPGKKGHQVRSKFLWPSRSTSKKVHWKKVKPSFSLSSPAHFILGLRFISRPLQYCFFVCLKPLRPSVKYLWDGKREKSCWKVRNWRGKRLPWIEGLCGERKRGARKFILTATLANFFPFPPFRSSFCGLRSKSKKTGKVILGA